ncbi:flagellar filament capping protein FliD [Bacillus sp. Y1]|nr:flagellar filament capping protein FliD [Bacillus sp. Y1]
MSMRIGGLASGMDIDTMVSDLMKAERIPLDKLKQKKQVLEWQRDDYRSMNTLLLNFRSELTNMRLSSTYRSRGTTSTDETKVTATASSAASLASYSISAVNKLASAATKVNSTSIADSGKKIDVNKSLYEAQTDFANETFDWQKGSVETQTIAAPTVGEPIKLSLKEGVSILTSNPSHINVKVNGVSYEVVTDPAATLDATKKQVKIDSSGNLTFSSGITKDSTIKVDYVASHRTQSHTMAEASNIIKLSDDAKHSASSISTIVVKGTNGAADTTYEFPVTDGVRATELKDADGNLIVRVNKESGELEFGSQISKDVKVEINYEQKFSAFSMTTYGSDNQPKTDNFLISGTESLNSVINKVNSSSIGVSMFYDDVTGRMTLTRNETGNFNLTGDEITTSGSLINNVLGFGGVTENGGDNAEFVLNGLKTTRTSNTFEVSGVTFTLKQVFPESTNPTPVNVNITNNTNQIFENIKGFVTKYNELIAKIQGEVQEERYKDYTPLTDEQREELSDKQQEQWEERAKSGMLRRDPTLTSLLNKMRSNFSNPVSKGDINPLYKQLASIGIKTSANYLEGGKLEIDEAALKKAIEADPTSVEKLFNATGSTEGEKGIAQRLTDTVNASMEKLRSKAGNSYTTNTQFEIGKLLNDVGKKISSFEDRLTRIEDRYWAQFTAMEKAIQRSNEQMNQLLSYTG